MKQSTSFAQVATNQFDYLSSALCANTPPCKKHSSSRKFLTLSISLRLLLVMFLTLTVSASAWGADYSKNESWSFNTSGNSNWTSVNCGGYCGGWGKNKDASPSVYKTDIQNFIDVDFSKYENVSLTIYVTAGHNSGTNSYTVKLIDEDGNQVDDYAITKENGMGSGSSSTYAKESSVTFNPTQSFSGYRIDFYPKSYITKTRYVLTYDDKTVSYSVNWTINPTAGGELSALSGNSTTVSPNAAYTYGSPVYTVTSGSATVSKSGDTFTATPTANSTIQINMVEKPKYTVTLMPGSGSVTSTTLTEISAGAGVELPTPTLDCGDWKFAGWAEQNVEEETDEEPILIPAGTYNPAKDITLYAVYSKTEDGGGTTIQSITTYQDGVYYIIDSFTDAEYKTTYHSPVGTKAGKLPSVDLTSAVVVNNNGILTLDLTKASLNDNMKYTISEADGNYSIYNSATGQYVGASASGTDLKNTNTPWRIDVKENRFMFWYQDGGNSARSFLYQDSYNSSGTKTYGRQFGNYAQSVAGTIINQQGKECYGSGYFFLVPATGGSSTTYTTDPSCVPTYTITWKNEDGTVLATDKVAENTMPEYNGSTPTKAADAQYTYTFDGWSPDIVEATEDATYTATYTTTINTYTITWQNEDGTTLETDENVQYGETPSYDGATPTKAATAQYTYTFNGWSPEVTSVIGDVTYTATFTETLRTYTITWKNDDGTTLETDENVPYGTTPSYDGEEPTKTATAQHSYDFNGWSPEVTSVTGDATYTATYTAIVNIIWMVNGIQKNSTTASSGASVTPPDVNPIPCGAVLAGWTDAENGVYVHDTSTLYEGEKPSIVVTENKTFYAVFADYDEQQ